MWRLSKLYSTASSIYEIIKHTKGKRLSGSNDVSWLTEVLLSTRLGCKSTQQDNRARRHLDVPDTYKYKSQIFLSRTQTGAVYQNILGRTETWRPDVLTVCPRSRNCHCLEATTTWTLWFIVNNTKVFDLRNKKTQCVSSCTSTEAASPISDQIMYKDLGITVALHNEWKHFYSNVAF